MNGKDLEKELLWEAPHIAKEAPAEREEAVSYTHLISAAILRQPFTRDWQNGIMSIMTLYHRASGFCVHRRNPDV